VSAHARSYMGAGASSKAPPSSEVLDVATAKSDLAAAKAELLRLGPAGASTRRRMERQREQLVAKYAMFGTLMDKAGGALKAEKVVQMVSVPKPGGGVARSLVKNGVVSQGALGGRSLLLPFLGPTELTSNLTAAAREVCDVLVNAECAVEGTRDVYVTAEEVMHITLFQVAPHVVGGEPDAATLTAELERLEELSADWGAFELEAHSVVLMSSGTILLLMLPIPETLADAESTRDEFRWVREARFPLASGSIPDIFHASLGRICFAVALNAAELAKLHAVCAAATAKVQGRRVRFDKLWYVTDADECAMEPPRRSDALSRERSATNLWKKAATTVGFGETVTLHLRT